MKIIICGHGNFATGIQSALSLIAGDNEKITAVDFKDADDGTGLRETLLREINHSKTLIVTDLYGGTPFRQAAMIAMEDKDVKVIAGTNLGILLELSFKLDTSESFDDLLEGVLENGREHISLFERP